MRSLRLTMLALALTATAVAIFGPTAAQARSTGAHIFNFTGDELRITEVVTRSSDAGAPVWSREDPTVLPPRKNQVLQPGEERHIEIENPAFQYRVAYVTFAGPGVAFRVELANGEYPNCLNRSGATQCKVDGGRVEFLDAPGTVHVVDAEHIQDQARALRNLCTKANECEFEPQKELETYTPRIVYGKTVTNCAEKGGPNVDTKIDAGTTVAISNSVGVEVKTGASFFGIFQAGISLKYEHKRSESERFEQSVEVHVEPEKVGWINITAPVIRDIGEFTLKLGNTAWKIQNVAFDSPDTSGKRAGNFAADYERLTPEQYKAECPHKRTGVGAGNPPVEALVPTSAALVQTTSNGTGAADLMRGGPESNTFRGLGGHDIIRGGGGNDTLLGGSGDDLIKGGPGEDTLNGGAGTDRIDDTSGPTTVTTGANAGPGNDRVDVADGAGDDSVHCDTPRTTVIVDPGDEVSGECGRVIAEGS